MRSGWVRRLPWGGVVACIYVVACILMVPETAAVGMSVLFVVLLIAVRRTTRGSDFLDTFNWFARHRMHGAFVILLTLCLLFILISNFGRARFDTTMMLLFTVLAFWLYWMMVSLLTYFRRPDS